MGGNRGNPAAGKTTLVRDLLPLVGGTGSIRHVCDGPFFRFPPGVPLWQYGSGHVHGEILRVRAAPVLLHLIAGVAPELAVPDSPGISNHGRNDR